LNGIEGHRSRPEDAHFHENVLSLVVGDDPTQRVRRLPSLYFWNTLVYSNREMDEVKLALARTTDAVTRAQRLATYRFNACRFQGHTGLYGRDFHNRSAFRLKASRQGLEFSADPFVIFHPEEQAFESDDFGTFEPEFIILANHDSNDLVLTKGAKLALIMTDYRMGMLGPTELRALIDAFNGRTGLAISNPENMVLGLENALSSEE
jgi:hypothetical protein